MPRYVYHLQPVLVLAFGAAYQPSEMILSLRARSEAISVTLRLQMEQAVELREALLDAVSAFDGGRFPVQCIAPCPMDSPLLLVPFDLEGAAEDVQVVQRAHKRLLGIRAQGRIDGAPFLVEIWRTPEQLLALTK